MAPRKDSPTIKQLGIPKKRLQRERQAAAIETLLAEQARQRESSAQLMESNSRLAADVIVLRADISGILARLDGKAVNIEGLVSLGECSFDTGVPYETLRRWCDRGLVNSQRHALGWLVDTDSVKARLRAKWGNVCTNPRKGRVASRP